MTCPVCGKPRPCAHGSTHARAKAPHAALLDHQVVAGSELEVSSRSSAAVVSNSATGTATELAWRQEVVTRVQQHRARRRRSADPNAMELDFTADEPYSFAFEPGTCDMPPPRAGFAGVF